MNSLRFFRRVFSSLAVGTLFWTVTAFAQTEQVLWSKADADPLLDVVFSHDSTTLALGREDSNECDLLNAADGTVIRVLEATHTRENDATLTNADPESGLAPEVFASEFSPDNQLIGVGDIFGAKIRNAADGSLIRKIANNGQIVSIAFSADSRFIA